MKMKEFLNWNTDRFLVWLVDKLPGLGMKPHFVETPLTSTDFDLGDAFSSTSKTLIDLSSKFGVPANVRAVFAEVAIRDSGSAGAASNYVALGPTNTGVDGPKIYCSGLANNAITCGNVIIPCNDDGDIYYTIGATGTNTFRLRIVIHGWWY